MSNNPNGTPQKTSPLNHHLTKKIIHFINSIEDLQAFPLTKVASNLISLTLAHEPRKSEENNDQKVCIGLQGCLALFKCPSLLAPLHLLTEWQQHLCSLRLPSIHIHSGVLFRVAFLIYNDLYSIRKRLPCFIPTARRTACL